MRKRLVDATITVPVPDHAALRIGKLQSIIRQAGIPKVLFETEQPRGAKPPSLSRISRFHLRPVRPPPYVPSGLPVKLAARLLGAAWHLMKHEQTFDPKRFLPHLVE